jgi:hypothetical protein
MVWGGGHREGKEDSIRTEWAGKGRDKEVLVRDIVD